MSFHSGARCHGGIGHNSAYARLYDHSLHIRACIHCMKHFRAYAWITIDHKKGGIAL